MGSKQITLTDYFYTENEIDTLLSGKVDKVSGKGLSTEDYTTAEKTKLSGIETGATKTTIDSSLSSSSTNPVQNVVINTALAGKVDKENGKGLFSGSYTDLTDKPTNVSTFTNDAGYLTSHQSLDSKTVTVEQQASAETGYTATYVVKQGGSQVGTKINIPKDFLVKSASLGTSASNNSPQTGFAEGDKYLDFIINTKDNSGTDEHLYVNVKDLLNEYEADETTLTLSNSGVFSIKSGVIPTGSSTATDIKMNGTQSAGSATTYAKADHVHPTDTSRAAASHSHTTSDISDFPTNVSSFTNDAGYITSASLPETDIDDIYDKLGLSYDDTTGILSLTLDDDNE